MLYLLPKSEAVLDNSGSFQYQEGIQQVSEQQSINLSGIKVNGSLLSEYDCSYTSNLVDSDGVTSPHLSVRYDKQVLKRLYQQLAVIPSASHYQLVAGTWRDF
ncbi:hypothetical protein [Psychromonas sp. KJ10-2]|uniref:hypothetical protein n=1 Tax=Psychromonas sp. KJ10-2 TaxID=3391822 RepID=UPI0039B6A6C3